MKEKGYFACILAGGRASRLNTMTANTPKCMLEFCGSPFIELLTLKLFREQCTRVILVTGHFNHIVESYVHTMLPGVSDISIIREEGGTAAALLSAVQVASSYCQDILCLNGDTILDTHYGMVMEHHRKSGCAISIVTTDLHEVPNFGAIEIDSSNRVISFNEGKDVAERKSGIQTSFRRVSNCGCYCFDVAQVTPFWVNRTGSSLEEDVLPMMVKHLLVQSISNGEKHFLILEPQRD